MKILIIEDEIELLSAVSNYLKNAQYTCDYALDLKGARLKLSNEQYDCFILDIGLPDGSGLDLIREIKSKNAESYIIIVSARNSTEDKVQGLNRGADDYLVKPFDLPELGARINSALRRYKPNETKQIIMNEIKILTDTHQVFIRNTDEVNLTKKEFDLLLYLISNRNRVISKNSIVEHLWGHYQDPQESFDFLYAQIKNLRKKITAAGGNDYIQTINRIGYRFLSPGNEMTPNLPENG
jgi:DNA-binding response OmpR family regulator